MINIVENKTNKIFSTLENSSEYRFNIILKYSTAIGFLIHVFFFAAFIYTKVWLLMVFNIVSIFIWGSAYLLNEKKFVLFSYYLCGIESFIHTVLASYCLGWDFGFHYYILFIVQYIIVCPRLNRQLKVIQFLLSMAYYLCLSSITSNLTPIYILSMDAQIFFRMLNIFNTFMLTAVHGYFFNKSVIDTEKKLKESNEKLKVAASLDPLTGLLNRRSMMELIDMQIRETNGKGNFSILIGDIDDFKLINDVYGHQIGDYVLTSISGILLKEIENEGYVSRWGGEEFLILLPDKDIDEAMSIGDKLLKHLRKEKYRNCIGNRSITMTFGASNYNTAEGLYHCIERADKALYKGKRKGKNCSLAL